MLFYFVIPLLLSGVSSTADDPTALDDQRDEPHSRLEELFLADLIYPQERGELQVSTGLWFERDGGELRTTLPLVIEWGLTDRLQLELLLPYEHDSAEDASGIGNVGIGALYQIERDQDGGPRVAIGADFTFPSATRDIGDEGWSFEPFVLAFRAGDKFDINAGLGLTLARDDGEDTLGAECAVAWIADLGPCIGTFELLAELDDGDFALSAAPGAVWHLGNYELGCALAVGLSEAAPDVQLLITLTREW